MSNKLNKFNEKGTAAEELIAGLCKDAFFQDFCFKNPQYMKGKELCDVLVILNDIAIIWQIKNLKLDKDGHFNKTEISQAIKQCRGARRRLKSLDSIELNNIAGQKKVIKPSTINEYFLIAAIEGGEEDFSEYYAEDTEKGNVHIFMAKFTRFAIKHLNTVSDFIDYLRTKEKFIKGKGVIIGGGEEDLLALFLRNNRSFGRADKIEADNVFFDIEGMAKDLEEDKDYKAKLAADRWSEGWDLLIQKKRDGLPQNGSRDDPEAKDKFLSKMMSHNRFERRNLGKMFFDAAVEAAKSPKESNFCYRRYFAAEGVTYVFLFMGSADADPTFRRNTLYLAALAARAKMPQNSMVIAIGSELEMIKTPSCSFDWVLADLTDEQLMEELTPEIRELLVKGEFFKDPKIEILSTYEYPSDVPKVNHE